MISTVRLVCMKIAYVQRERGMEEREAIAPIFQTAISSTSTNKKNENIRGMQAATLYFT